MSHIREGRNWNCPICDKHYRRHSDLQRHQNTQTGEKPYKCQLCDFTSAFRNGLRMHERDSHSRAGSDRRRTRKMSRKIGSPITMKQSEDEGDLWPDVREKYKKRPGHHLAPHGTHKCLQCDFSTNCKGNLTKHERRHPDGNWDTFPCPFCNLCAEDADQMRAHVILHQSCSEMDKTLFQCKYCTHTAVSPELIRQHEEDHRMKARFICDVCGEGFIHGNNLSRHKSRHGSSVNLDGRI